MMESEFRDWTRGQLRSLEERLKAVAAQRAEPAKLRLDARIQGEVAGLISKLAAQAKAGQVAGLAIAFVNAEGTTMTGWAANGGYYALAGAATFMGLEILEDFRKAEAANDSQPAGHAGADQAPVEG